MSDRNIPLAIQQHPAALAALRMGRNLAQAADALQPGPVRQNLAEAALSALQLARALAEVR